VGNNRAKRDRQQFIHTYGSTVSTDAVGNGHKGDPERGMEERERGRRGRERGRDSNREREM
jgi:hypothetical protein